MISGFSFFDQRSGIDELYASDAGLVSLLSCLLDTQTINLLTYLPASDRLRSPRARIDRPRREHDDPSADG